MSLYHVATAHQTKLSRLGDGRIVHGPGGPALVVRRADLACSALTIDPPANILVGPGTLATLGSAQIVDLGDGEVGLRMADAGPFLCAAPGDPYPGFFAIEPRAWERFRLVPAGEAADVDPVETALAANMLGSDPGPADAAPRRAGRELDGIAAHDAPWSVVKATNLMLMRARMPSARAAVVAAVRDEGCYLLEWLAHMRATGFGHAFIYTNDNRDSSLPLLEALHRAGRVTLICNQVSAVTPPQVKAYEHSIHLLPELRHYEWVGYFDADEFLVPDRRHDYRVGPWIDAVEAQWTTERPAALCVNWDWYGSGGHAVRAPGLVQERFVHSRPHTMVKSIVRLSAISTMGGLHMPDPGCVLCVDASGARLDATGADVGRVEFSGGKLNHYYHKSLEEFIVKHHRGRGGAPGGRTGKPMQTFFQWDVPPLPARACPTPPVLLGRVKQELTLLRQLPGVAAAEQVAIAAHAAMAADLAGPEVIQALARHARGQPAGWGGPARTTEAAD